MKLIATTLMMTFLCLMPLRAQERDNIDGNLRVKYTYFFKMDSTKRGFLADSSMCLDLIGNEAAFYSEKCFIVDSSLRASPFPITVAVNPPQEFKGTQERSRYFLNYKTKKYIKYDKALLTAAKGSGTLEQPLWKIIDRYDTICGYPCRMAEAHYLGRTWGVWYTPSIPASAGPWLLWGAPGLILYAEDRDYLFIFRATEIGELPYDRRKAVKYIADTWNRLRSYRNIQKMEEILTMTKRSYADDERMNGLKGEPFTVTDPDGTVRIIEQKYIPLIPEDYWEKKGRKH